MLSSARPAAALALRGELPCPTVRVATNPNFTGVAKPTSAIVPYRSIAAISSSASKTASALTSQNASGFPLGVTGKPKREVLLPSQEPKKGAMQYALYVLNPPIPISPIPIYRGTRIFPLHCQLPANPFSQNNPRSSCQLGPPILPMAHDLWTRLLRRRNDASLHPTIRSGSPRYYFPCLAASVRCHDCCRNFNQQDGPGLETSLRSDARAEMGHLHGKLRQRRWILPLQLQCDERLRSHCSSGHLCSRMPANLGGVDVRRFPASEKS